MYSMVASGLFALTTLSANPVITVVKVNEDIANINVDARQWGNAKETPIALYPQTTIKLNDKKANVANANNGAKIAFVKALSDGKNIAFKVRWQDDTQSIQSGNPLKNTEFADGFALQFATNYEDFSKLPYIGMGSKDRPVVVYLQKAVEKFFEPNGNGDVEKQLNRSNVHAFNSLINNDLTQFDEKVAQTAVLDYQKAFIAQGFRSMTEIKDNSTAFTAQMSYQNHWFSPDEWEGVLVRSLNDEYLNLKNKPFPVSFALWDGEKMGRDGLKNLSTWVLAQFEDSTSVPLFNQELPSANLQNGEMLTKTNCASCHNYGATNEAASAFMAPNLSNIGGYSTTEYLYESIKDSNAVVVPGYNVNSHPNFAWYDTASKEGRTSAMPSFDYLTPEEMKDIVAYLKTLKVEVSK